MVLHIFEHFLTFFTGLMEKTLDGLVHSRNNQKLELCLWIAHYLLHLLLHHLAVIVPMVCTSPHVSGTSRGSPFPPH